VLRGASPSFAFRDALSGAREARPSGGGWLDEDAQGAKKPRVSSGTAGSRTAYLGYQTALSTYVYGVGVPLGLGADEPRVLIATPLIAAPVLFGIHLATAPYLDFSEAHVKASTYASTGAVYASTALALAFSPDAGAGYRIGSLIGAGAYPLSLWYAQGLGDEYRAEPDRLDAKMLFALGYGFVGLVTPVLYFESPSRHEHDIARIGLGQSVGMALAGHVIADYYQPRLSTGVQLGLATHAALGGLAGVGVAAFADASASPRPWLGAAVIGSTLGFTEGVFFFRNSRDSRERAQYAGLGAVGGSMMGLGLQILFYDEDATAYARKVSWSSFLIGGAFIGYAATYALTGDMVETATAPTPETAVEPSRWSFNPMPEPEIVMSRGEPSKRWRVPGLKVTF
jgi:hypothetical protein